MARCEVCFRHCTLREGQTGFCGGRICEDGEVRALNFGRVTSLALDPIEKKPLSRFHPGSRILSVGSFGCGLRCPFCQNYEISWSETAMSCREDCSVITPAGLVSIAERYRPQGNIGLAFTYNEPLIGYEFVRDTARLVRERGMKNAVVTNGSAELWVLGEIAPFIDAFNIDLKCFDAGTYKNILGGDLQTVLDFITKAHETSHVELTTLIVPGMNDSERELRELSSWIAALDTEIPLHISRFFPRFKMTDRAPTDVGLIYRLADIAREKLRYVYTGNC
ncbi:MAG: AmmeMemoRadiSam system radical SAM enzyme [Ruminococcus sp.]|nr:AmmeMemoRadiSam system radical SAM enzyme [Ruminococcus sp.]